MFFYMVKKEIVQTLRNKFNLFLLFIFPIVSVTCMGFALNDLMEGNGELFKGERIVYNVEKETAIDSVYISALNDLCEKLNIKLEEENGIKRNNIFIKINNGKISYEDGENKLLNSLVENYLRELVFTIETGRVTNIYEDNSNFIEDILVEVKVDRGINAFHYYGLVQIVLIIMYLSLTLGESVNREWEEDTLKRIMISKASKGKILFSKLFVGIIIGSLQILEGIIFTKIIIGIDLGPYIKVMIALLFLFVVLCSLFGLVLGFIIKDGKSLSSVINISIIVFAMLGGAYFPLSFIKNIPVIGTISKISPVYWVNEGLINLSIGNFGESVNVAFIYLICISIVLIVIYFIFEGFKRRD